MHGTREVCSTVMTQKRCNLDKVLLFDPNLVYPPKATKRFVNGGNPEICFCFFFNDRARLDRA